MQRQTSISQKGASISHQGAPRLIRRHLAAILTVLGLSSWSMSAVGQGIVPDFSLPDENSTSTTYQTNISPRDYVGQVSGWYFGLST